MPGVLKSDWSVCRPWNSVSWGGLVSFLLQRLTQLWSWRKMRESPSMPAPPPARPPTVLTLWPEALPHISSKAPREAGGSMGSSWDHQGGLHGGYTGVSLGCGAFG